ncbi:DUF4376 domain-containing protein [Campylobacter jejuni]|uniref:DUF4376 domain-containing protein n=1 Tax=Campylobacter jejuni TaxID=197 RepID=UPI000F80C558|nr:DUF4376 domain-containing protein [Campylobacter jejuni]ECP5911200.1 DUF4376 domain-containing protein [Campylobacter jejuni]RTI81312.1 hypothetical protein C3I09_01975 [Campylobacter jejuni]RTI93857.1 hypothetical protein C3I02_05040 [Campylobacter jejuni]RTJ69016.1 hypothetical protein C3H56_03150 [Campylobacter jejuni]RTJ76184.1 hypothetical protein C3H54_05615 [Campylobacter jejuni]
MLISKTTLSYLNDTNLKEHILYAIQNEVVLSVINRDFTEDENGNRIDDITPEEIQVGTQAVKEYCLANNNMNLYFEYLLAISQEDERLNILKEKKKHEIQTKRDEALERGLIYKEHTFQTREKDKLNINGAVTNLMLDIQSEANSISEIIWIDINDEKVTFTPQDFLKFASMVAYHTQEITFKANILKERIEQAKTLEEIQSIKWNE